MLLLACLLLQEFPVTITVTDAGRPIFARVVLKNAAGQVIDSTGYKTLNGHFVPPDGWKVSLPRGSYSIHADAGFEFHAHDESWNFEGGAEKKIELKRWVNFRKEGWHSGGDHNHLIRGGAENKNYGGKSVTLEFAASLHASRGWSYYASGGGGPWIVDGNPRPLNNGRRTELAAAQWNQKYGDHLHLWWNNEILKTRYGHVWFIGACASGPVYPYTEKAGDAWWAFYDDSWDPWQTGDKSKPIGPFKSGLWEIPPVFDCIRSWRDRGLVSIYAHPTRTFMIGQSRVSNIAVEFPFDLLAGVPVALAVMGDAPDHAQDQALWFAALNEGFHVPGVAENDTVYGSDSIRSGPHVTYTHVPDMGATFDMAKLAAALGAGRNFISSGAFGTLKVDGKHVMGDTVPETGQPHEVEVRAWASADRDDRIESIEVIADGKVVKRLEGGSREATGAVSVKGVTWVIAKVRCKNRGAVAITNPVYFRKPPEPLRSTVKGRVTRQGAGVPADIVVSVWGKELSRSKAGPDGTYRLEGVPIAAHLVFSHAAASTDRTILFHDAKVAAIHAKIWTTDYAGKADSLAGAFPPDFFKTLRDLVRETTIDADLGN